MKKIFLYVLIIIFTVAKIETPAQTFGFGCLGLSGIYGGYTISFYNADGLNDYLRLQLASSNLPGQTIKFGEVRGMRIGANVFRAKFDDYFITLKGFYQFQKEEKKITDAAIVVENEYTYSVTMDYWGVGLDFGFPLFNLMDLKLIEGGVTFNRTEFNEKVNTIGVEQRETNYSVDKITVGYFVATGLLFHIVPDYISIEGTASYNFLRIKKLNAVSMQIPASTDKNFINNGGFAATLQLNIGFPL